MELFFDTETTGMWSRYVPPGHPSQPRLLQLAMVLMDGDTLITQIFRHLNPGIDITASATAVHGITKEFVAKHGVSPDWAVRAFNSLAIEADVVVGHNVEFDLNIMRHEAAVANIGLRTPQEVFCTMKAAVPICKLLPKSWNGEFKWPKLSEAHHHFFGCDFQGAHNALSDTLATIKVYNAIRSWRGGEAC